MYICMDVPAKILQTTGGGKLELDHSQLHKNVGWKRLPDPVTENHLKK